MSDCGLNYPKCSCFDSEDEALLSDDENIEKSSLDKVKLLLNKQEIPSSDDDSEVGVTFPPFEERPSNKYMFSKTKKKRRGRTERKRIKVRREKLLRKIKQYSEGKLPFIHLDKIKGLRRLIEGVKQPLEEKSFPNTDETKCIGREEKSFPNIDEVKCIRKEKPFNGIKIIHLDETVTPEEAEIIRSHNPSIKLIFVYSYDEDGKFKADKALQEWQLTPDGVMEVTTRKIKEKKFIIKHITPATVENILFEIQEHVNRDNFPIITVICFHTFTISKFGTVVPLPTEANLSGNDYGICDFSVIGHNTTSLLLQSTANKNLAYLPLTYFNYSYKNIPCVIQVKFFLETRGG
jgi:hypothetical protein